MHKPSFGMVFLVFLTLFATPAVFANTLAGIVYNDLSGNGTFDGDPGLQGWTVDLFDSGMNLLGTRTTDTNGAYAFLDLNSATYTVGVETPNGWVLTSPAGGVYTESGSSDILDFGAFQEVTVSGNIYNDLNGNGQQNTGEPPLQGWTAFLDGTGLSAVSDVNGNYTITGVGPGSFQLKEMVPAGWAITQPTSPNYYTFTSSSGVNVVGGIFGNQQVAATPEPGSLMLMGSAFLGLAMASKRKLGKQ